MRWQICISAITAAMFAAGCECAPRQYYLQPTTEPRIVYVNNPVPVVTERVVEVEKPVPYDRVITVEKPIIIREKEVEVRHIPAPTPPPEQHHHHYYYNSYNSYYNSYYGTERVVEAKPPPAAPARPARPVDPERRRRSVEPPSPAPRKAPPARPSSPPKEECVQIETWVETGW